MCDRSSVRCDNYTCWHHNLLHVLDGVGGVFEKHDIPYWLSFGTLLGAVRSGHIISWDEDFDIGILETSIPDLEAALSDLKEVVHLTGPNRIDGSHPHWKSITVPGREKIGAPQPDPNSLITLGYGAYVSEINSLHMDIFVFKMANGIIWSDMAPTFWYPEGDILQLDTVRLEGIMRPCPSHPEHGIAAYYGKDWRTPKVRTWQGNLARRDIKLAKELDTYEWYD